MIRHLATAAAATLACSAVATADTVDLVGGQTSVLLDTAALEDLASLSLSGVTGDVIVPGNLGPDSVAFGINPRNGNLPTTFSYDPDDFLNTFSGSIEHSGSVLFNDDTVEVGDFTIGFDANRAGGFGGAASGFFVESTAGIAAILFDIENPTNLVATETELTIEADLLVSAEFGQFLFDNGLSDTNLAGADVGDALVQGVAVPGPAGLAVLAGAGLLGRRRRRA